MSIPALQAEDRRRLHLNTLISELQEISDDKFGGKSRFAAHYRSRARYVMALAEALRDQDESERKHFAEQLRTGEWDAFGPPGMMGN